jgi:hypothetical protein
VRRDLPGVIWKHRKPIGLDTPIGNYPHVLTAARDVNDADIIPATAACRKLGVARMQRGSQFRP